MTEIDETNCFNVTSTNGGVGKAGNLCQVDCGNRGLCDYKMGECHCFKNFYGLDCTIPNAQAIGTVYDS